MKVKIHADFATITRMVGAVNRQAVRIKDRYYRRAELMVTRVDFSAKPEESSNVWVLHLEKRTLDSYTFLADPLNSQGMLPWLTDGDFDLICTALSRGDGAC